jgi:hypothetical protein
VKALLVALALLPTSASAHCYSIWHFKNAQRCGGSNQSPVVRIAKRMTVPAIAPPQAPGPSFDLPLPDPDPLTTVLRERLQ